VLQYVLVYVTELSCDLWAGVTVVIGDCSSSTLPLLAWLQGLPWTYKHANYNN